MSERYDQDRLTRLRDFQHWMKTHERHELENMLCDVFVKQLVSETMPVRHYYAHLGQHVADQHSKKCDCYRCTGKPPEDDDEPS